MSLHSLPSEIVSLILDHVSIPELLNLCLTDKRSLQLTQPRLFQRFILHNPVRIVKYCLLMKHRSDLALAVHYFLFDSRQPAVLPVSFWKLCSQGFSCMSNITSLAFSGTLSDIIFRDVTFPHLKAFTSLNYFTPEVLKFLGRHSNITGLFLGCRDIPDFPQEILPSLGCFKGTPFAAEKIVPSRPIIELAVTCGSLISDERAAEIIKIFSLSSTPIIRFSYTILPRRENRIPLLTAIAQYLPDLQTLHLSSCSMTDPLDFPFVESLTSLLPSFKHLRRLLIPLLLSNVDDNDFPVVFHQRSWTVEWKQLCPELLYITFPSCYTYMYDTSQAAWVPTTTIPSESTTPLPHPF